MGLSHCFAVGMGHEQSQSCCLIPVVPARLQADPRLEAVLVQSRTAARASNSSLGQAWSGPFPTLPRGYSSRCVPPALSLWHIPQPAACSDPSLILVLVFHIFSLWPP